MAKVHVELHVLNYGYEPRSFWGSLFYGGMCGPWRVCKRYWRFRTVLEQDLEIPDWDFETAAKAKTPIYLADKTASGKTVVLEWRRATYKAGVWHFWESLEIEEKGCTGPSVEKAKATLKREVAHLMVKNSAWKKVLDSSSSFKDAWGL